MPLKDLYRITDEGDAKKHFAVLGNEETGEVWFSVSPLFPGLSPDEAQKLCAAINTFVFNHARSARR